MSFEEEDLRLLALWLLAIGYLILAFTEFAALGYW
ncbi:hypothetical protein M2298_004710 [Brevibacillus sp. 1238]|jgi:hypothetical protein|nr:hypothetical protein [Brevibacillus sp. 1238]